MVNRRWVLGVVIGAAAWGGQVTAQFDYPETRKVDQVDVLHGVEVADPYRWLEDDVRESEEVADWVAAQNEVTFGYLETIEERDIIAHQIEEQFFQESIGTPGRIAVDRWVVGRRDGVQEFSVTWIVDDPAKITNLEEEGRVLLDPNTWSDDGSVTLAGVSYSPDGKLMAYSVIESGSDWRTWRFMDVETGEILGDELKWARYTWVSWDERGEGVFYAKYPEPESGVFTAKARGRKIMYHRLGTPQSQDVFVHAEEDEDTYSFGAWTVDEGRYLMISTGLIGERSNELHYVDLRQPFGPPRPLITGFDASYSLVAVVGDRFLIETDLDAPAGRIIAIDADRPEREHWMELIPESEATIRGVSRVGSVLFVNLLEDAKSRVRVHRLDGTYVRDVDLPGIGTASGFGGKLYDTETWYTFRSFDRRTEMYRYDILTGRSELVWRPEPLFDPDDIIVEQVFYASADGTRVPMFIAHKKGVELDGDRPTRLYGYGGFNVSLTPFYSSFNALWLELGGVYALANIRGGGEYGREWHMSATKTNRQRAFDDFIAAAEYLIDEGYTNADRIAIEGGSNGGLLVGACMTQRPDLFGAAIPSVGVLDMLRYHLFTIGYAWATDYGTADDPDEFAALHRISPYHAAMRNGPTEYPPTLIMTADTDDRVVPAHSFKFAAAMQANHRGDAPMLLRIETSAGHGAGTALSKAATRAGDHMAFLVDQWGLEIPERWRRDYAERDRDEPAVGRAAD